MKKTMLLLSCIILCTTGCQTTSAFIPKVNKSEYFATRSAGFLMDVGEENVQSAYYLSLEILKPLEKDGYIEAKFENPAKPHSFIVVGNILKANQDVVDIQSPEVEGIKKLTLYDVKIDLYEGQDKEQLLGTHKQKVSALHSEQSIQQISKN